MSTPVPIQNHEPEDDAQVRSWERFFKKYAKDKVNEAANTADPVVVIDWFDLDKHDRNLAEALLDHPLTTLSAAQDAIKGINVAADPRPVIQVRIRNLPSTSIIQIRDLREEHLGRLVAIRGLVKKAMEVKPKIEDVVFQCGRCGAFITQEQTDEFVLSRPIECYEDQGGCGRDATFKLISEETRGHRSTFVNVQTVEIQEFPELMKGGEQPQRITVQVAGSLCAKVKPGNRITITGRLRTRIRKAHGVELRLVDTYLDANHIESETREFEDIVITEEDEAEIIRMSRQPDLYEKFLQCIAPHIFGLELEKLTLLLQLFGGVRKELPDGGTLRGDTHVLFVGDPGVAKSQLIKYMKDLSPRGVYASGKSSSSAGLTAAAVKEEGDGSGRWTIEAGAAVLADGGLLVVDEMDKMNENDQSSLHEAMESQSYHPETELILGDGRRVKIGAFVDEAMTQSKPTQGVNCEILQVRGVMIPTVDLLRPGEATLAAVDRVSRHPAPSKLIRVTYSNGRSVIVTPEHPIFVVGADGIVTAPAEKVSKGAWVPAPRKLVLPEIRHHLARVDLNHPLTKPISMPETLNAALAEWLGLMVSEGHTFVGERSYEVGLSNKEGWVLDRATALAKELFGIEPSTNFRSETGVTTLRWCSRALYDWLVANFAEQVEKARQKRIPECIMAASEEILGRFLRGAWTGDGGFVNNSQFMYATASKALALDYADALLRLEISSLVRYQKASNTWKVIIAGGSRRRFVGIIPDPMDRRMDAMAKAVDGQKKERHHDVVPPSVVRQIEQVQKMLGMKLLGDLSTLQKKGFGMQVESVWVRISEVREGIAQMRLRLAQAKTLREVREAINGSEMRFAPSVGVTWWKLHDAETRDHEAGIRLMPEAIKAAEEIIRIAEQMTNGVEDAVKLRYWKIESVETIHNQGQEAVKMVYDVTVEPTHTFVANGVALHNTVTINKAGLSGVTLPTRCSIAAAANPKEGRFDDHIAIHDQIDFPPAILSRFDVIFVIRDKPTTDGDKRLSRFVLGNHQAAALRMLQKLKEDSPVVQRMLAKLADEAARRAPYSKEQIQKYVAFAKRNCVPVLSDEAMERLSEFYTEIRKQAQPNSDGESGAIPLTARQLEAIVRLAEASARIRLSDEVMMEDAERAIELVTQMLHRIAGTSSGALDVDKMISGKSKTQRDIINTVLRLVKENSNATKHGAPIEVLEQAAAQHSIGPEMLRSTLEKQKEQRGAQIIEARADHYKWVG